MNQLETIKSAIQEFEALQAKYSKVGAYDSEPSAVFQWLLHDASQGKVVRLPLNSRDWQLYTSVKGASTASSNMTKLARKVVALVQNCPLKDSEAVLNHLREYCWRCI